MSKHMDRIVREAVATGLLAPGTINISTEERHWPVLVFTAFAAWLSAIPLIALIIVLGSNKVDLLGMTIGLPILIASVFLLRARQLPLFVEQLGAPGLLIGATLLAFQSASNTNSMRAGVDVLLLIACVLIIPVRQAWIRTLLGAAIGILAATRLSMRLDYEPPLLPAHLACSVVACAWLLLHLVQRVLVLDEGSARMIAGLDATTSGLAVGALVGMIWSSGRTFVLGSVFDLPIGEVADAASVGIMNKVSVGLSLASGVWLALRWPVVRKLWYGVLIALCMTTAWFTPSLGAALLILSFCVESRRNGLATFASFAAAWMIGALYYTLMWPLEKKALLLVAVGLALTLLGRYAIEKTQAPADPKPLAQAVPRLLNMQTRAGFLLCGVLVLGIANVAIWQKENIIRTGTAVYVELAPIDPRSLLQGDYMRLSFLLPTRSIQSGLSTLPPQVVGHVDKRGVAQLVRLHDGSSLAKEELVIDIVRRHGSWTLVTDAWYFKEGESERWSKARYGEFRVAPDGKALLVGLRGPKLEDL